MRGVRVPSTVASQGYRTNGNGNGNGHGNGHGHGHRYDEFGYYSQRHGHTPSQAPLLTPVPVPRFGVPALMLKILHRPDLLSRVAFFLWPLWVYGPVVLQTYLDFGGAWCLIQ
jgi:hypothetical protein